MPLLVISNEFFAFSINLSYFLKKGQRKFGVVEILVYICKKIKQMKYGRKIINYIFAKRSKRPAIRYELERKVQADSDRSDIRVFETGLSPQQYGDNWQSTRNAEEAECQRLVDIAQKHGLYINKSEWEQFGDRRSTPTGESVVFLSKDESTFTKMKSPFAKAPMKQILPGDIIYEHLIHNILFPSTRYHFIGISEDSKGLRIVLQQQNVSDAYRVPTQKDIDDYLMGMLGLSKEDRYFYGNEYFAITDVSNQSDNVLCDDGGRLYFIDPIIRLKRPALEVWEYLYQTKCI